MLSTLLNLGNLISSIKVTYSEKKDDVETGVTLANVKKQEDKIKKEVDGARHKISTLLKEHTFSSEGILRFPIDLGGTNPRGQVVINTESLAGPIYYFDDGAMKNYGRDGRSR